MKLPEYDNRPSALYNPSDEGDWPILKGLFWAGVGIVAVAAIGMFAFGQKLAPLQMLFIAFILVGAVGLRLTIDEAAPKTDRSAMSA